ncbi:amidohydrolase [Pilibacter termitis]|uniref:amidohydrolase n=1 Tax=Pilibacter termitis TaxID=263852 RepID=UPI000999D029|nr:amidohydrolase [Pilibacter termitis]
MTKEFYEELVEIRHYLHQHPELSNEEFETTKFLKRKLEEWGIAIVPTSMKTGVIAEIGDKSNGKVIALRADIDALPINEKTGLPYSSVNEGIMHACGHDFHQTSLLGAAKILKENEDKLNGLVRLIFQPAEEVQGGAVEVIQAGHLEDVQAILGFHNHPKLKVGEIALIEEGIMASVDQFFIKVHGIGTHAAEPQLGVDVPIVISTILTQLQTIVARNIPAREAIVLSVTHIETGQAWNVLPDDGFFEGTIRSFNQDLRKETKQRFVKIIENTAESLGASVEIIWGSSAPVTYNCPKLTKIVVEGSKKVANVIQATPSNAGEDFSHYQEKISGVFAFIGTNGEEGANGWHHSNFLVKDEALPIAVNYYVENAFHVLDNFLV